MDIGECSPHGCKHHSLHLFPHSFFPFLILSIRNPDEFPLDVKPRLLGWAPPTALHPSQTISQMYAQLCWLCTCVWIPGIFHSSLEMSAIPSMKVVIILTSASFRHSLGTSHTVFLSSPTTTKGKFYHPSWNLCSSSWTVWFSGKFPAQHTFRKVCEIVQLKEVLKISLHPCNLHPPQKKKYIYIEHCALKTSCISFPSLPHCFFLRAVSTLNPDSMA